MPDRIGLQDSELHHLGQNQSASQPILPLLHLCGRIHPMGEKGKENRAFLQLRADEGNQRRNPDAGCMDATSHRALGKNLR